jgi:hypothetical protein
VLDIDALRQALGADKIALWASPTAQRRPAVRARLPEHVDRLILDSIVGPTAPTPSCSTPTQLAARARRAGAHGACRNATKDPWPTSARSCGGSTPRRLRGNYYDSGRSAPRSTPRPTSSFLLIAAT